MRFDIITIFPEIFESYFNKSIIKRALRNRVVDIKIHNLRDYTSDKRKTVDESPYGGGAGMILKIEPIWRCIQSLSAKCKVQSAKFRSRTILFSAKGKKYMQADAKRLSRYDNLILICGRYEGIDERVAKYVADEEISIGDYVLTGGEIPAMILADSITRLLPGVLGNPKSLLEESFSINKNSKLKIKNLQIEYAQYTRPEVFHGWKVPKVLLGGNHNKIKEWRLKNQEIKNSR